MPNFSSSKRFAQAIYAIAKETDTVSDWVKNLESINDILSEKDLVATLNSPNKPIALKCSILDKIYGESLDRLALNLLYLLSTRNSIDLISNIKSDFENMVKRVRANLNRKGEFDFVASGMMGDRNCKGVSFDEYVNVGATWWFHWVDETPGTFRKTMEKVTRGPIG